MISEIGLFCLLLSLVFALLLSIIPSIGLWRQKPQWVLTALIYARAQFVFIALSYIALTLSFLNDDFTVTYVLQHSSLSLPWFYKLCAVWGGHEGSMLLWTTMLSAWMVAVTFFSRPLDLAMQARILVILGLISVGFIIFLLTTSNPFNRQFLLLHSEGQDLNPLLQDPGFLFHPPMLYMGYVGFSVAFAFAIAALWAGEVESSWAKWTRPWTLAAWCCLTAGITLGSWWAYRELGWGGWWFWDPVENASFMPWLVGTALLHSLAVCEHRRQFQAWTVLLAISAFSLSLIGTFLVRSGILTSVHAFAVDPKRGLYILGFLSFVVGGALLLFSLKANTLKNKPTHRIVSRESALLLNNVFLFVVMLTVLLGTVYPLLLDGLGLGKLSVGAPYFNTVFIPLMIPLFVLMGFGAHLRWRDDSYRQVWLRLWRVALLALGLPGILLYVFTQSIHVMALVGLGLAFWITLSTGQLLLTRLKQPSDHYPGRAFWGMVFAHIGVAMSIVGVTLSTQYGMQDDVKMAPGTTVTLNGYSIQFLQESSLHGQNYHGVHAAFLVSHGHHHKRIFPEKRIYDVGHMPMTESAIDVSPFRDIYVALGEPLENKAWSVRVYYKPFIRWIWGGGFMILAGGLLAIADKRYYQQRRARFINEEPA